MGEGASGKLDRRIALSRLTTTNTGLGPVEAWAPLGTVWASRKDVSDAEKAAAGTVQGTVAARFIVRSSTVTRGLIPSDRLSEGGLMFEVIGIKQLGRRDYLEISAEARLDDEGDG
jgi:head-tail adaptor